MCAQMPRGAAERIALKLRAQCRWAQAGGVADKRAGQRGNAIPPYLWALASFKRMLGSPALRQRQEVPIGVFEPCYLGGARRPPDAEVVLVKERKPLED